MSRGLQPHEVVLALLPMPSAGPRGDEPLEAIRERPGSVLDRTRYESPARNAPCSTMSTVLQVLLELG